jgi:hypothetical protein
MLRLGHLTVFAEAALDAGGSWRWLIDQAAKRLTAPTAIGPQENEHFARYAAKKRLCATWGGTDPIPLKPDPAFRYPGLVVTQSSDSILHIRSIDENLRGGEVVAWWQDAKLAAREVRSRVGAITVSGKRGSKTGLSHIGDWAQLLQIINQSGDCTPTGRLIAGLRRTVNLPAGWENPYVLSGEKVVYAAAVFRGDYDLLSRFLRLLTASNVPVKKANAQSIFAEVVNEIATESLKDTALSSRQRFHLTEQLRDLEKSAKRSRKPINKLSTTWHRISSRLEVLVDIGLLDKGLDDEEEKYSYIYHINDRLRECVASFSGVSDPTEWVEQHLVEAALGHKTEPVSCSDESFLNDLACVVASVNLPSSVLPIDLLAEGLAWIGITSERPVSLANCRTEILELARTRPELARLARGRDGTRAEFVSLDVRKLSQPEVSR